MKNHSIRVFSYHYGSGFPDEVINRTIENMLIEAADPKNDDHGVGSSGNNTSSDEGTRNPADPPNKGTLIIDTTCAPTDIAYPTDLELCDEARRWTEVILDHYWSLYESVNGRDEKPHTYREIACHRFLKLNKRRRKSTKKIRKELRYQLGCICRNQDYIQAYALEYGFEGLYRVEK